MLPKLDAFRLHRKLPPQAPPLGFPFSKNLGVCHPGVPPFPTLSSNAEGPLRRLNHESIFSSHSFHHPHSAHPTFQLDCSTQLPSRSLTSTYVFISSGWLTRYTFKIQTTPKRGGERVSLPLLSPDARISFSLEVTNVTSFWLIPLEIIAIVKSKIICMSSIHFNKSEQLAHRWVYYSISPLTLELII